MSWSIDLFISGPSSLSEVAAQIERLTGLHLQHVVKDDREKFETYEREHLVTVGRHDLVNDGDRQFERYPYKVSVWPAGSGDKDQEVSTAFATRLYERLEKTHLYRVMLVADLLDKLRESAPMNAP
jgi:hypothetical protein